MMKPENQETIEMQSAEDISKIQLDYDIIICDPDLCNGCRICEYVCAITNEKKINPRLSRIRTIRVDPTFDLAVSCRKCDSPTCLHACARNCISQDSETRLIRIDKEKCDGCGLCVRACKFGVMTMGIDPILPVVCDTCEEFNEGRPVCVDYCPKQALEFTSINKIKDKRVRAFQETFQKDIDEKK